MPQLQSDLAKITKRKGPAPTCVCGECLTCKNRLRQRKWHAKQLELRYLQELEEEQEKEND